MSPGPVILAAGGTGGHLFPAEALSREFLARGRAVALVTDARGAAFPVEGVASYRIPAGRSGPGLKAKVTAAVEIARGTLAARRLLKRLGPGAVVGFGGYPSLPTMLAAAQLRLPTVIHEQNAVLGRANRTLAPRVRRIATAFEQVDGLDAAISRKLVQTGNPVRPAIIGLRTLHYEAPSPDGTIHLLIIGGSLGARILSDIVPPALALLDDDVKGRLAVSQQVRREDLDRVRAAYDAAGLVVETRSFFDDIPARLGAAQLLICRAGGSTTAELTVSGRPAILVPYAAAIADEQTANAQCLVERGAAWLLPERDFTAAALAGLLAKLVRDPSALARAAAEAHALGRPAAAQALADLVEEVEAERGR